MTTTIIILLCSLLLFAYFFDVTSARSRIPAVILLLLMGWAMRQGSHLINLGIIDMSPVLPILGTIGLILIVLEGSLEITYEPSRKALIGKAFFGSSLSVIILSLIFGYILHRLGPFSLKESIANAVPLCIISSAIAIPTARHLNVSLKEFVIYESSMSDILGVLVFNFVVFNEVIDGMAFVDFGVQLILMAIVSVAATLLLAFLLQRIHHPVKFIPIILLIMLIYEFSKVYNLPSLMFILLFGLALGNIDEINQLPRIQKLGWNELEAQVKRFKEITTEMAFLIRSLFFILFGYTLEITDILDLNTILWSTGLVVLFLIVRAIQLRLLGMPQLPLLFIAPRGLITILLFLSIPADNRIPFINKSLLTQVILLTSIVMMVGLIMSPSTKDKDPTQEKNGGGQNNSGDKVPAPQTKPVENGIN